MDTVEPTPAVLTLTPVSPRLGMGGLARNCWRMAYNRHAGRWELDGGAGLVLYTLSSTFAPLASNVFDILLRDLTGQAPSSITVSPLQTEPCDCPTTASPLRAWFLPTPFAPYLHEPVSRPVPALLRLTPWAPSLVRYLRPCRVSLVLTPWAPSVNQGTAYPADAGLEVEWSAAVGQLADADEGLEIEVAAEPTWAVPADEGLEIEVAAEPTWAVPAVIESEVDLSAPAVWSLPAGMASEVDLSAPVVWSLPAGIAAEVEVSAAVGRTGSASSAAEVEFSVAALLGYIADLEAEIQWLANSLEVLAVTSGSVVWISSAGALTEDNANLFWDATNHRLGIGTNAPAQRLTVSAPANTAATVLATQPDASGTSAVATIQVLADTANLAIQAHGTGRTAAAFGQTLGGWCEFHIFAGNGLIIGTDTAKPLVFGTNNAERMRLDSTGELGIGTDSPTTRLDLFGGTETFSANSSTATKRTQAQLIPGWLVSTDATRAGYLSLVGWDTNARECIRLGSGGSYPVLGFFGQTATSQPGTSTTLANNVSAGGTTDVVDNWSSLTVYATDAAAIRNAIYQLARKVLLIEGALKTLGLAN